MKRKQIDDEDVKPTKDEATLPNRITKKRKIESEEVEPASSSSNENKCTIIQIKGDLFQSKDALCHCVSEDFSMGKGIAGTFKQKFGKVAELKKQNIKTGQVAVLKHKDRYIYYLVTKVRYNYKPTYDSLERSLKAMRDHMIANQVNKLSMPQIGCGLDKLKWDRVEEVLHSVFKDIDVTITVYSL
jgi:O-acetyl-ADP-ribose deacetylase (regulator of RNase III)